MGTPNTMHASLLFLSLSLLFCFGLSLPSQQSPLLEPEILLLEELVVPAKKSHCPLCVNFMDEFIEQLINIIANGGVIGGCADLCGKLKGGKTEKAVCDILCDIVGIKEFIKLIDEVDPDPIWICEQLGSCDYRDNASASVQSVVVSPNQGPQGSTFVVKGTYSVSAEIGTGEVVVSI